MHLWRYGIFAIYNTGPGATRSNAWRADLLPKEERDKID